VTSLFNDVPRTSTGGRGRRLGVLGEARADVRGGGTYLSLGKRRLLGVNDRWARLVFVVKVAFNRVTDVRPYS
jgi:hypothetical protein